VSSSLQAIFREHFPRYAQQRRLPVREWRAANAIMHCHCAELGGHLLTCPAGHHRQMQYHACRHRSCPRCADQPRQKWVQTQLEQLLPCAHFHAVFTLPHDFLPLWKYNRAWLNTLLFDCVRQSLLELCADPRHLGATPGLLMALHTWGRTLSLHPHVHCLVSAGGLDSAGQWHDSRVRFLVPVQPLSHLFRGKLLHHLKAALTEHRLTLPPQQGLQHWLTCIRQQYRKHWNVELSDPYAHGRGVALYLARYVKGGPLSRERALHADADTVRFGYTDHRDGQRKQMTLTTAEFISRVLTHAPPRSQHLVRHCGLYASAAKAQHRQAMQLLRPAPHPAPEPPLAAHGLAPAPQPRCPQCDQPLLRTGSLPPAHRHGEFSVENTAPRAASAGPTRQCSGPTTAAGFKESRRHLLRRCSPLI
jgi:hypothetical protein